jgi:eukaryotic-like serine/threonine-protein kinase
MNQPPRPPPVSKRTIQGLAAAGLSEISTSGPLPARGEPSGSLMTPKEGSGSMGVPVDTGWDDAPLADAMAKPARPPAPSRAGAEKSGAIPTPRPSGRDPFASTGSNPGAPEPSARMSLPEPPADLVANLPPPPVPSGALPGQEGGGVARPFSPASLSFSGEMPIAQVMSEGAPSDGAMAVAAPGGSDEGKSVAPPPMKVDPYIGVTIDGRYKIESVLGEGGMGVVYAGRHKVINKRVAIKVLRADLSRDKEMTERFLQEARAASSIGHPHIVDVSDFGELPDGSAFFVMEFLEGQSLTSFINEVKPLPTKRLIHVSKQVADALAAAHTTGIIHRDLKPDNVFVGNRGLDKDFVKILDFGIAKVATSGTAKLTRAGTVFGTPHYMSPEQAAGAPVDHRTDIYALGVIMYEMAAGKVPFDADNYMGILTQHMYKAPVPIRMLVPPPNDNIPPGLEAIILKALSKKPEQRYASMGDVIEDLDRLDKGEMPQAVSEMIARSGSFNVPADYFSNPGLSNVVPGMPPEKRKQWGMFAGGAGVLAAVVMVTAILSRGSDGKATTNATEQPSAAQSAVVVAPVPTPAVSVTPVASVVAKPAGKPVLLIAEPLDAEVWRDGENLGKQPVTINVAPGEKLEVEIRKDGYVTKTVSIDEKKPRVVVRLPMLPKAPRVGGPAPNKGEVKPRTGGDIVDPWAKKP